MAKVTGLTTAITVDNVAGTGKVISNDITSIEMSTPRGTMDITGVNKPAVERTVTLADGSVTLKGVFNADANMSHDVFAPVTSSNVARTVVLGYPSATLTMEIAFSEYSVTRGADGSLVWTSTGQLATGVAPVWS